jgi:hypothetical protein
MSNYITPLRLIWVPSWIAAMPGRVCGGQRRPFSIDRTHSPNVIRLKIIYVNACHLVKGNTTAFDGQGSLAIKLLDFLTVFF